MILPMLKVGATRGSLIRQLGLLCTLLCAPHLHGQLTEAWVRRYNHPTEGGVVATKIVTDNSGNVVVIGDTARHWIILKLSPAGVPLWTNRYAGPLHEFGGIDQTKDVTIDIDGKVFVTGSSPNFGTMDDYVTIAYSSSGTPLWTNRYDGSASGPDIPTAIVVASGHVYVCGESRGYWPDYSTICYTTSGMPLWTNLYNGPENVEDRATAATVDSQGNLIVTGVSEYKGLTVAYSSAGVALWTNRFGQSGASTFFWTTFIDTDANGNVFVGGWGTDSLITIGYSTSGAPLWTNHYLLPSGGDMLAVAAKGKVIVAGNYGATIAYSTEGAPLWTNRYPAAPAAIAVNTNGQVYITGSSSGDYVTVAYASSGAPLWTNRCSGSGSKATITLNTDGDVLVSGSGWSGRSFDLTTLAYSGQGIPLWTNRYKNYEGNRADQAKALAVSASGAVFVTGSSVDEVSRNDYATVAYSSSGEALWTNRYDGQNSFGDIPTAMAIATNGNVFITGYSDFEIEHKYVTTAYSHSGHPLWTNLFAVSTNVIAQATAIGTDDSGNCFVAGFAGDSTPFSLTTIGYSNLGEALWTNRYGPGSLDSQFLAVDRTGKIFVAGSSPGTTFDYAAIAYSNAGQPLWTNRYGTLGSSDDFVEAMAVAPNGNVIVAGYSSFGSGTTVAYSSDGTALWTNKCELSPKAVATDVSGQVFLAGTLVNTNNFDRDYGAVAYSSNGAALWTNRFGRAESLDPTVAIAVNKRGHVIVAGASREDGLEGIASGITTITYSLNGQALGTNRYSGLIHQQFSVAALATDALGDVVLAGTVTHFSSAESDFITIKYALGIPTLDYQVFNNQLVLSWTDTAFALQSAPLVSGPFTDVPGAGSPYTNSFVGAQRYFRLKGN